MKFSRVTAAIVMASLSSPLFAGAEQSIGKMASASQGTYISRDGKLIPAVSGQALYVGDKVVTRSNAKASVAFQGCTLPMASTSMVSVNSTSCADGQTSFAAQDDAAAAGGEAAGAGAGSTGYIIAGLAVLAAAGGVVAATSSNSSAPTSP